MVRTHHGLLPFVLISLLVAGCAVSRDATGDGKARSRDRGNVSTSEITREQAIEIAREQVSFEPRSIEAVAAEEEGRPVWKVTFRGRPPGPEHAIGELLEVLVDRQTGKIVSLAMS